MKMAKPKLTITPPPNTYNPYSLDLLSKLKDDLAIIGKLTNVAWRKAIIQLWHGEELQYFRVPNKSLTY